MQIIFFPIYVADSRFDRTLHQRNIDWPGLCEILKNPKKTPETAAQYAAMPKEEQLRVKDVGGFVGATLRGGVRNRKSVGERTLITLDYDAFSPEMLAGLRTKLTCRWVLHSTHKHSDSAWRVRIIIMPSRPLIPDEYSAVCRRLAERIGMDGIDRTTAEAERLMFWPSVSADAPYLYEESAFDNPLDVVEILHSYRKWQDASEWPLFPGEGARVFHDRRGRGNGADVQADPREKEGAVGAFCRCFDIHDAISTFIPDTYYGRTRNRYTYAEGHSSGGAIVRDEGRFLYSFHATDPASGSLCNSFDLIRLHKFGDLDANFAKDDPKPSDFPSFKAMEKFAMEIGKVRVDMSERRRKQITADFDGLDIPGEPDPSENPEKSKTKKKPGREKPRRRGEWEDRGKEGLSDDERMFNAALERLPVDKGGAVRSSSFAVDTILEYHPETKGRLRYNEFTDAVDVFGDLPWKRNHSRRTRVWGNADDANLRVWLDRMFGISGKDKISDALVSVSHRHAYHPVKEYLESLSWDGTPRIGRIFTDVLGAEDTPLNREIPKLMLRAAVARIYEPGKKYDYCPILQGYEGTGKSSFGSILAGEAWFNDTMPSIEGKTGMESLRGVWIVEMAEMSAIKKSDVATMKAFISRQVDKYRPAYGRVIEVYPRQCTMYSTTNDEYCLRGLTTGNRRSPIVEIKKELRKIGSSHWDWLHDNRDQVWAEAVDMYRRMKGIPLMLPPELEADAREIQDNHNLDKANPLFGEVVAFLDMPLPPTWDRMKTEERIRHLKGSPITDFEDVCIEDDPFCDRLIPDSSILVRRQQVSVMEILRELFELRRDDKDYRSRAIEMTAFMNSLKEDWELIGMRRIPIYGSQRCWKRKIHD